MRNLATWLSLFTSSSTLVCCALPSLLVALGMGATMAGLVSSVPQIIWFSQYKFQVFLVSGTMIAVSAAFQYRARFEPCPIDQFQAELCRKSRQWSLRVLLFSSFLWCVGAFFAFLAPHFLV